MRSVGDAARVRLYHLDHDSGAATTLLYGTLAEALALAAAQPEAVQDGLFVQTDNDVVAYADLVGG
jgi:hypothetical protein